MSRRRRPSSGRWENPVSPLQAARFERRWEQKEVCYRVRRHCPGHRPGEPCHIEPSKLSDYEHGKRTPSMKHLIALCRVYDKTPEELGLLKRRDMPTADTEEETVTNGADNSSETNPVEARYASPDEATDFPGGGDRREAADLDLVLRALLGEGGSDQMRRDQFIKGVGAVTGAAFIDPLVLLSQETEAEISHTRVSNEQIEHLTAAPYLHVRGAYERDRDRRLRSLTADWLTARRLLELPLTLRQELELTNAFARLTAILACCAVDYAQFDRARALRGTARTAAQECGDTELLGWIYAGEAGQADNTGHPHDIVAASQRGLEAVGASQSVVTALLHAWAARGYASMDNRTAAATHIEMAERILGKDIMSCWPSGPGIPRGYTFVEDGFAYAAGVTYLRLGDDAKAITQFERAEALYQQFKLPNTATVWVHNRIRHAAALAHIGELEGAVQTATTALTDYQGAAVPLALHDARKFERTLTTADTSGTYARQFSEFLRSQMN
jgi:tetratricopeptide (TPR) repeat protein